MKRNTVLIALSAALLCFGMLASCTSGNGGETESTDANSTGTVVTTAHDANTTEPTDTSDVVTMPESATQVTDGTSVAPGVETTAVPTDTADIVTESVMPETDTDASVDTEEPEVTTEAETRYDYFAADVSKDVMLDRSVYTDIKLTLPSYLQITDEDVADYILYLRYEYAEPVNGDTQVTDQPLQMGDSAFIYYRGVMDGEEFDGGSNWESETPYELGLGSGAFIPGFEAALVGVTPAHTSRENPLEIHVTFPKDYDAHLAGKEATFYVYIVYSVQYTMPAYDLSFIEDTLEYVYRKEFYASDKARFSEFEAYVKSFLEEKNAENIESAKSTALWEHLLAAATIENMPQSELDYYYNYYVSDIEYGYESYKAYYGTEFTDKYPTIDLFAVSFMGLEEGADWRETMRSYAEKAVKQDMIVHAVAEMEGMEEITEEEFNEEVSYWVEYYSSYGLTAEDIIENMGEDYLRQSAFSVKMNEFFDAHVTVVYVDAE